MKANNIQNILNLISEGKTIDEIREALGFKNNGPITKNLAKYGIDYEIVKVIKVHRDNETMAIYKAIMKLDEITLLNIHNFVYKVYPEYNLDMETIKNTIKGFKMEYKVKGTNQKYYVILVKDGKEVKQLTKYSFPLKAVISEVVAEMNKLPIENGIFTEEEICKMYDDKEAK
jgi:hypothetical protein